MPKYRVTVLRHVPGTNSVWKSIYTLNTDAGSLLGVLRKAFKSVRDKEAHG